MTESNAKPQAPSMDTLPPDAPADTSAAATLLQYYEAIERASADMLEAARRGRWDEVVKLEGACTVLISQLKASASQSRTLGAEEAVLKSRIMQRILVNDAEIRNLAEPWLDDLDRTLQGSPKTLH